MLELVRVDPEQLADERREDRDDHQEEDDHTAGQGDLVLLEPPPGERAQRTSGDGRLGVRHLGDDACVLGSAHCH